MELKKFLQSIPAFAGLDDRELTALDHALCVATYPDGHVFFQQGDRPDAVYIVIDGEVRATVAPHGENCIAVNRKMGPGELFGLIALIDHGRRGWTCVADGPVKVGSLPTTAFYLLFNSHASLACHFQRLVAVQLARDGRDLSDRVLKAVDDIDKGNIRIDRRGRDEPVGIRSLENDRSFRSTRP